jgi:hypothetical protein
MLFGVFGVSHAVLIEVRSTHYHGLVQNAAAPIKQVMIIQLLQWTMTVARVS